MNQLLRNQIKTSIHSISDLSKAEQKLLAQVDQSYQKFEKQILLLQQKITAKDNKDVEEILQTEKQLVDQNAILEEFAGLAKELIPDNLHIKLSLAERLTYFLNYLRWLKNENNRTHLHLGKSELTTDLLLEVWDSAILIINLQKDIIKANKFFYQLFRISRKGFSGASHAQLAHIFSKKNLTTLDQLFTKIIKEDVNHRLELVQEVEGKLITLDVKGFLVKEELQSLGVLLVIDDISAQKEQTLLTERREKIIEAINFVAGKFLIANVWSDKIPSVLEKLGKAADVSRIYLFENYTNEANQLSAKQLFEWTNHGIVSEINNQSLQGFAYQRSGFQRWVELLSNQKIIAGIVADFPKAEQLILTKQKIISILIVPIWIEKHWWGFIGFDDCISAKTWSVIEIDALQTAAQMIGLAIHRTDVEKNLEQSNQILAGRNEKLKEINRLMIGRELKMIELKKEIAKLKNED
ncbi:MAG: GAF domain-containing protein [bacterium]